MTLFISKKQKLDLSRSAALPRVGAGSPPVGYFPIEAITFTFPDPMSIEANTVSPLENFGSDVRFEWELTKKASTDFDLYTNRSGANDIQDQVLSSIDFFFRRGLLNE